MKASHVQIVHLRELRAAFLLLIGMAAFALAAANVEAGDTTPAGPYLDVRRLIGRWVRPDGGYILEIKEIAKDGTLQAAYFNPRPINVSVATCRRQNDVTMLFVELRDVNYPGSTYNLRYDPEADRLLGTYFQAVAQTTYAIEFIRVK